MIVVTEPIWRMRLKLKIKGPSITIEEAMREDLKFYEDAYCREIEAEVTGTANGAILLDRTIFFPATINLPSDCGTLRHGNHQYRIETAVWLDENHTRVGHILADNTPPMAVGTKVLISIDWEKRYLRMRAHSALHLVASVLPYPIVGGALYDGYGHKEFSIVKSGMQRHDIQSFVTFLVGRALPVREIWDTRQALEGKRHLRVVGSAPPTRPDLIRAIEIGNLAPQACDGLHVRNTAEVGALEVKSMERIGGLRWRVWLRLRDAVGVRDAEICA